MNEAQSQGYLALPAGGTGPHVLVLHAWWGQNETIRSLCRRLAAEGFVAFAPDLYHGQVTDTIPGAEALSSQLDYQQARAECAAAAAFLAQHGNQSGRGLAVIGFSLGAYYAYELAAEAPDQVDAVVLFYGAGDSDVSNSRAAYLGHFADNDAYEPQEYIDGMKASLAAADRPVTFHTYPNTGHWFFEPDREDAYNQAAAELAWQRTVAFLKRG